MTQTQTTPVATRAAEHDSNLSPVSLVRPDLLGFSFHLAWLCLFMYNVIPGFVGSDSGNFNALDPVYFYSAISLAVTLCLGIAKTRSFMRLVRSKTGCYTAPLICSCGTFFYTLCAMGVASGPATTPLVLLGGIMTGVSSAMLAAHWASVFGRAKARAVIMNFTLILAAVLVACLAISYLFPTTALVVATLLPLASGASLIYADRYTAEFDAPGDMQGRRRRSKKPYAILVGAVALLGLSTGCLPQFSGNGGNFDQIFYSATSVIVLGAVGWLVVKEHRKAFPSLFVAPLTVLIVFALPYVRFTSNDVSGLLSMLGNASIELMLLFEAVLFALLFDYSCARAYMIARLTMAVSDLSGWLLSTAIMQTWGTGAAMQVAGTAILIASEIVVAALVVTYLLLRKKSSSAPELNTQAAGVEMTTTKRDVKAPSVADGSKPHAPSASQETDAINLAIERHGLSPREADVLRLLVDGDSTAQIQDKLCIAPGTFNYHMRNIYAKLGVHSRQELLVFIYNQPKQ